MAQHETSDATHPAAIDPDPRVPPSVFEERYGAGSRARLIHLLEQPCVTFAAIAERFGVSRERVRQWHRALLPDAPTGHARQQLCALHLQRRRLFRDPLFRTFFRQARPHFGAGVVQPIHSRHGYRTRDVLIDGRLVALRDAAPRPDDAAPARFRYRGTAAFLFISLGHDDFLFVPAAFLRSSETPGTVALASLERFRNSFDALPGNQNVQLQRATSTSTCRVSPGRRGRGERPTVQGWKVVTRLRSQDAGRPASCGGTFPR